VKFKDGMMSKVEEVTLGDSIGGLQSAIRYKLSHRDTQILLLKDPNIPMGYEDKGKLQPLELNTGAHTLHLECKEGPDYDDDGAHDMFVEVRKVG
jgi:hypothetical protein